jgi:sulfoxide reductase catalytic subunit YedY
MKRTDLRILPSEITPQQVYLDRRRLLAMGVAGTALITGSGLTRALATVAESEPVPDPAFKALRNKAMSIADAPNSFANVTTFNNYYEFGTEKSDPAAYSKNFRARPWSVAVDGEAEVKGSFTIEDIIKPHALEERVYRLRCVEGWSMVIPWTGFPLADLIKRFKPTSKAKFVEFTTLHDAKQMPGQRNDVLEWPYVEGLRMDEAMHPLTFVAVGLYGQALPNQCGAPLRLVTPWKYGFKNIKAIVRIRFTEKQPRSSWEIAWPQAYGFYANVNPAVDHPSHSQATERRLGSGSVIGQRVATLPFNGYANEVASLYSGMDLRRYF